MNRPFCENPECELHWFKDQYCNTIGHMVKEDRRGRRTIYRHQYADCMKGVSYFLCDICHTAVQMNITRRGAN